MENVKQHNALHNVRCLCSHQCQVLFLHERIGVVLHPYSLLNELGIILDKSRTKDCLLT